MDTHRIAWSTRGHLIYLLALPLVPALLTVIERGELLRLAMLSGALAIFVIGAVSVRYGIREQRRRAYRRYADAGTHWLTWLGCAAVAAGCFVTQRFLAGNDFVMSGMMGLTGFAGAFLSYGSLWQRASLAGGAGYTGDEITDALMDAENRVSTIKTIATRLPHGDARRQLKRIASKSYAVLQAIEKDPGELRRARRFLNVFLPGIEGVAESYLRANDHEPGDDFETRFRTLLAKTEEIVDEQQGRSRDKHIFDLDVQMEVLKTQLDAETQG